MKEIFARQVSKYQGNHGWLDTSGVYKFYDMKVTSSRLVRPFLFPILQQPQIKLTEEPKFALAPILKVLQNSEGGTEVTAKGEHFL